MSKDGGEHQLEMLILALVSKRVSMSFLLAEGFTPGQVMRALVDAQDAGYIVVSDKKSELSKFGLERLDAYKIPTPKAEWIIPLESQKVIAISVADIFLPNEDDVLD